MNFWLLILFGLLVLLVWWLGNQRSKYSSDTVIDLSGTKCFNDPWLEAEVPRKYQQENPRKIAQQLLQKLYSVEAKESSLIIGSRSYEQYVSRFDKQPERWYDLRSSIGLNYQIIIEHPKIARTFEQHDDYSRLVDILETKGALEELKRFFNQTMTWRWNKLQMTPGSSYLYLNHSLPNVVSRKTELGQRYNLLTSEREFNTLVERYRQNQDLG